jgi:hypothetical protein
MIARLCISILALGTLGILGGCSTSGPAFQQENPATDRALVYIYRQSRAGGSASAFKIFANGQHITNMSNGGYFPYSAPAGPLDLSARIKANVLNFGVGLAFVDKPEVKLDVVPGETYFVELQFGSMSGTKLIQVDAESGLQQIRSCNRTETIH